jgi:hypothetical protein
MSAAGAKGHSTSGVHSFVFRNGSKDQISDVQLQIWKSLDSGFDARPVIGRALRGAGGIAPE